MTDNRLTFAEVSRKDEVNYYQVTYSGETRLLKQKEFADLLTKCGLDSLWTISAVMPGNMPEYREDVEDKLLSRSWEGHYKKEMRDLRKRDKRIGTEVIRRRIVEVY